MIETNGPCSWRIYCPCLPGGVDLQTVTGAHGLRSAHHRGVYGQTHDCPRCGQRWALCGRIDGHGLLEARRVGPGRSGTLWEAQPPAQRIELVAASAREAA